MENEISHVPVTQFLLIHVSLMAIMYRVHDFFKKKRKEKLIF